MAMEELVEGEEVGKYADVGGAPPTENLASGQVPSPPAILLAVAGIWAGGPGNQVAGQGWATSSRARG